MENCYRTRYKLNSRTGKDEINKLIRLELIFVLNSHRFSMYVDSVVDALNDKDNVVLFGIEVHRQDVSLTRISSSHMFAFFKLPWSFV